MTTLNGEPQKTTAHQLWCNYLQNAMEMILWPKRIQNGKSAFMTSKANVKDTAEHAIAAAIHFENTRLRILVDEMIKKLSAANAEVDVISSQYKETSPFRIWKRFRIKHDYQRANAVAQAYQDAVKILVNTPPPSETPEQVKPEMKVSK